MLESRLYFVKFIACASGIVVLLTGCPRPPSGSNGLVIINYHQVGACNGYVQGNNTISVGPNAAYVVYNIESIDNSKTKIDFHFDPTHLFVNGSTREFVDNNLSFSTDLGVLATVPVTVPHGTKMGINGFSIVVVSTSLSNGAKEASQTNYFLLYDTHSSDPGVLPVKTNATQTTWPETDGCRSIQLQ